MIIIFPNFCICKSQYIFYIYATKFVRGKSDEFRSIFCWKLSYKKLSIKCKHLGYFKGNLLLFFLVVMILRILRSNRPNTSVSSSLAVARISELRMGITEFVLLLYSGFSVQMLSWHVVCAPVELVL